MKIIKGNKTEDLTVEELKKIVMDFDRIELDIGTGDGRYIYSSAIKDPGTLFIGVDPSAKQLAEYSRKSVRKKIKNVLFVVGSIELFPKELALKVHKISIYLPWGSLLASILNPNDSTFELFKSLLLPDSTLKIVLGYSEYFDPGETKRLNLPEINGELINSLIAQYQLNGFKISGFKAIHPDDIKYLDSTWAKKLAQNSKRNWYELTFKMSI